MRIDNIKLKPYEAESRVKTIAADRAGLKDGEIGYFRILRKSIDARDKGNVHLVYAAEIAREAPAAPAIILPRYRLPADRVVVVGSGPCGLFAALILARRGFRPLVLERGGSVEERAAAIRNFNAARVLDENCNVQFGEGGAGTFSDGKLNTGVRSPYKDFVLGEFVAHGAPANILYDAKPHIGSDRLPAVVAAIRREIVALGGEFRFRTALTGLKIANGFAAAALVGEEEIPVAEVVLAIGHSARDTYRALRTSGLTMESKDCAVGLRIEHLRKDIDRAQFGRFAGLGTLGAADYKLTSNVADRGVFTFCMCPGGYVMAAASEKGGVVTNGMSNFARDGVNSNAAVVVQVRKSDYLPFGDDVMAGFDYLGSLERAAFAAGGGDHSAPVQLAGDFLRGGDSRAFGSVMPTYPLGTRFARLDLLLPDSLALPLKAGIADMDRRLKGFAAADAVLTGVETRTSSPIRILRGEALASPAAANVYPGGETGHAGGIMSAALDGVRIAETVAAKYAAE